MQIRLPRAGRIAVEPADDRAGDDRVLSRDLTASAALPYSAPAAAARSRTWRWAYLHWNGRGDCALKSRGSRGEVDNVRAPCAWKPARAVLALGDGGGPGRLAIAAPATTDLIDVVVFRCFRPASHESAQAQEALARSWWKAGGQGERERDGERPRLVVEWRQTYPAAWAPSPGKPLNRLERPPRGETSRPGAPAWSIFGAKVSSSSASFSLSRGRDGLLGWCGRGWRRDALADRCRSGTVTCALAGTPRSMPSRRRAALQRLPMRRADPEAQAGADLWSAISSRPAGPKDCGLRRRV